MKIKVLILLLVVIPAIGQADLLQRPAFKKSYAPAAGSELLIHIPAWQEIVRDQNRLSAVKAVLEPYGLKLAESLPLPRWSLWRTSQASSITHLATILEQQLAQFGSAVTVQPNYRYHPFAVDPERSAQWYLTNTGQNIQWPGDPADEEKEVTLDSGTAGVDVGAEEAWLHAIGSPEVLVAVLDSGIDRDHPDLRDSIAENENESVTADGIDTDGNGYTDDRFGFDFCNGDADPEDSSGHGTGVAAVIGALRGDGAGLAGLASGVRILPIKFIGPDRGSGEDCNSTVGAIKGIEYAIARGADVLNMSFGGPEPDTALRTALEDAQRQGLVLVAAAGNDGSNNDKTPTWPANLSLTALMSVASHTNDNKLSSFSNYGKTVHLAAPGSTIRTATVSGSDLFSQRNPDAIGGKDRRFILPPTQGDLRLDTARNWGIATLTTENRVLVLDARRLDAGTEGYGDDSLGTWTSTAVAVSDKTQIRLFAEVELRAPDRLIIELSADDGDSWKVIKTLEGTSSVEVHDPVGTWFVNPSTIKLRLRPDIRVGSTEGLAGGVWIGSILLWDPATADSANLPLHVFTQGTSLSAPLVSATAALLRSQTASIPNYLVVQRILAAARTIDSRDLIAGNRRLDAGLAVQTEPFLYFAGDVGYSSDGAEPDTLRVGETSNLRIAYVDPSDWSAPFSVTSWITEPGGTGEQVSLDVLRGSSAEGLFYQAQITPETEGEWIYRFFAVADDGTKVRGPSGTITVLPPMGDGITLPTDGDGDPEEGGCGCSVVDGSTGHWLSPVLLALFVAGLNRRRRKTD